MEKVYNQMGMFSARVFHDATAIDHLEKLKQEAQEAKENPDDIIEYADCVLCLFGAATKRGFTYEQLLGAIEKKLLIVENTKWTKQPDGTYQHNPSNQK